MEAAMEAAEEAAVEAAEEAAVAAEGATEVAEERTLVNFSAAKVERAKVEGLRRFREECGATTGGRRM